MLNIQSVHIYVQFHGAHKLMHISTNGNVCKLRRLLAYVNCLRESIVFINKVILFQLESYNFQKLPYVKLA